MMDYKTPSDLADLADEVRTESHATIADHLGVSRSAVSHALNDPSPRRIRFLPRILGLYGYDVDRDGPAYPVEEPPSRSAQPKDSSMELQQQHLIDNFGAEEAHAVAIHEAAFFLGRTRGGRRHPG